MDIADVTGFVEERMNGQRVIKVFNHERISEEEFDQLNEKLYVSASNANSFRQHDGAYYRQHRKPAVCSDRCIGRRPLGCGNWGHHPLG